MPQASPEERKAWGGPGLTGDAKAHEFLTNRGWREVSNGLWFRPVGQRVEDIPHEEWDALNFLINEWDHDYGGPTVAGART